MDGVTPPQPPCDPAYHRYVIEEYAKLIDLVRRLDGTISWLKTNLRDVFVLMNNANFRRLRDMECEFLSPAEIKELNRALSAVSLIVASF